MERFFDSIGPGIVPMITVLLSVVVFVKLVQAIRYRWYRKRFSSRCE